MLSVMFDSILFTSIFFLTNAMYLFSGDVYDPDLDSSNVSLRSVKRNNSSRPLSLYDPPTSTKSHSSPPTPQKSRSPGFPRKSFSPSLLRRSIFNRSQPEEKCAGCGFQIKDEKRISLKRGSDLREVYHPMCFKCIT